MRAPKAKADFVAAWPIDMKCLADAMSDTDIVLSACFATQQAQQKQPAYPSGYAAKIIERMCEIASPVSKFR
jgi:hypothetical protein